MLGLRRRAGREPRDTDATPVAGELRGQIEARAREHGRLVLAHYVWVESSRQHVSVEVSEKLEEAYGKELALPVLDLSDLYQAVNTPADVREAIAAWLEAQGLTYNPSAPISASLARPIEEHAREEARQIVAGQG